MRSVIRPALVTVAAVGMALAGAASAQACEKSDDANVNVTSVENEIENSFNSIDFNNSFNGTVIDA
jgi:hypothetical protein